MTKTQLGNAHCTEINAIHALQRQGQHLMPFLPFHWAPIIQWIKAAQDTCRVLSVLGSFSCARNNVVCFCLLVLLLFVSLGDINTNIRTTDISETQVLLFSFPLFLPLSFIISLFSSFFLSLCLLSSLFLSAYQQTGAERFIPQRMPATEKSSVNIRGGLWIFLQTCTKDK